MRLRGSSLFGLGFVALLMPVSIAAAQTAPPTPPPQATAVAAPAKDSLGRDTPRGTVLGFLAAARRRDAELASQYLDTTLTGQPAAALAHQLFVVLDARLPARLTQISDAPGRVFVEPAEAQPGCHRQRDQQRRRREHPGRAVSASGRSACLAVFEQHARIHSERVPRKSRRVPLKPDFLVSSPTPGSEASVCSNGSWSCSAFRRSISQLFS